MRRGAGFAGLTMVLIAIAAGRAAAYVAIVPDPSGVSHTVASFDTTTDTPFAPVTAGLSLLGAAITPDARTGYVVAPGSHELTAIRLDGPFPVAGATLDLTGSPPPPLPPSTAYLAIAPDGRKAYVSDGAAGGNSAIVDVDLTGRAPRVVRRVTVDPLPEGIAFAPDGRHAYVASAGRGTVTPITVSTDRAGRPIAVAAGVDQLAITPDGRTAYATQNGSDRVFPITLATRRVGAPITVGSGPVGIAITPDGRKAYVTDNGVESTQLGTGTTVTPITLATGTPGPPIAVGRGPWAVAVTPDGRTAYVTTADGVFPIDTATDVAGKPISLGVSGRSIAITPDVAPVAALTVVPAPPGAATTFDASASRVRFGTIVRYAWDFGDGSPSLATAVPHATHVYAQPGLHTATVTETDGAGTSTGGGVFTGQTAARTGEWGRGGGRDLRHRPVGGRAARRRRTAVVTTRRRGR